MTLSPSFTLKMLHILYIFMSSPEAFFTFLSRFIEHLFKNMQTLLCSSTFHYLHFYLLFFKNRKNQHSKDGRNIYSWFVCLFSPPVLVVKLEGNNTGRRMFPPGPFSSRWGAFGHDGCPVVIASFQNILFVCSLLRLLRKKENTRAGLHRSSGK